MDHRTATVSSVQVFAAGNYRDRNYTIADLDKMAENFRKLGPNGLRLLSPPIAVGHEEDTEQKFLDRTDLPAGGWVKNLRRIGKFLIADFSDVPAMIAQLINRRSYKKCSAEIYDDFKDDNGRSYGMTLRRVALLGATPPQVKSLADVPMAVFSDRPPAITLRPLHRRKIRDGVFVAFSEVDSMPNDAQSVADANAGMRPKLEAAFGAAIPGVDPLIVQSLTDDQIQAILTAMGKGVADTELEAVSEFAERNKRDLWKARKETPAAFVRRFSETRRKNPKLARQFVAQLGK